MFRLGKELQVFVLMVERWNVDKKIWLGAGGTAGHLLPAIGVAEALASSGVARRAIEFIGSKRPIERRIVEPYGFELVELDAIGFTRRLSLRNFVAAWKMFASVIFILRLAVEQRPVVIAGFGGYFSFPPLLAGWMLRIPRVVIETNAVAGRANRLAARFATRVLACSASSGLPKAEVVAVPLRPELAGYSKGDSDGFRERFGIGADELLLCAFGGSLGSRTINWAVMEMVDRLQRESRTTVSIYHVIGARDYPELHCEADRLSKTDSTTRYIFCEYDAQIYMAIADCDLVVCRAGSGTVAEIGYFATPSILVPLPNAPGDHQRRNALELEKRGSARIILDAELTGDTLFEEVSYLFTHPDVMSEMSIAARGGFPGDGAKDISAAILELAGGKVVR